MSKDAMTTAEPRPPMDKRFDPESYEPRLAAWWHERDFFRGDADDPRESFCIMIPPPNVTGKLHMGHALQTALQDLLTRWKRMQGYNALWVPGTDHAGIATQLMVERALAEEGTSRREIGRAAFVERCWRWKQEYHDNIRRQLLRLGASCDFSRERFTMDEGLSRAVTEAFVRLHREGLIYRGEYMVNWSPQLDTAVSDLEVEMKTVAGKLYHVAYPVEGSDERIVVATTRPETMLGDTAVAKHPDDERYRHLTGRAAILPLVGRRLPFVDDEVVEREFGTGLVKVTPSHDPADFEIGKRHDLPRVEVIGRDGRMTARSGDFAGLDRFEARRQVVERLRAEGWLVKVEDYTHNVGHSQRGGEPVEPLVSLQWFCDVEGMARRALAAVEDGRLALVPESWVKTWEHWLGNIKPWCISRQLWWGHRIPAFSDREGRVHVARDIEEAARQAGVAPEELTQDGDVLDTWFSSGLWPFSTLGWPDDTADLRAFHPTDVLVTGHDILFFWVARMAMFGLHFTDDVPFRTVHLTGLVRDADGVKMSKTKGNVLDPLDLAAEYGADALRFTLSILDAPGRDIPMDLERMAGYRGFCNKIWNATRFALARIGEDDRVQTAIDPAELAAPERWILARLSATAAEVDARFGEYRFDEACNRLYHFFWGELCDWYIELAKPALFGDAPRPRVGDVLLTVLDHALRLLHPVMPFLTEELWHRLPGREALHPETIALAPYPERVPAWEDAATEERMAALIEAVTRLRALRADLEVPPAEAVAVTLRADDEATSAFLAEQAPLVAALVRASSVTVAAPAEGAARDLVAGIELGLVAPRRELGAVERERLEAELGKLAGEIAAAEGRLANEQFLAKAPPAVVAGNRARLAELVERRERIRAGLEAGAEG
ncbi:MAG TPA: valine--tRNA ligase [Thermoanaerobaculia bacterium]|nr:valine--tRNA ligase [Thermoanaerobaculia bacterium]